MEEGKKGGREREGGGGLACSQASSICYSLVTIIH